MGSLGFVLDTFLMAGATVDDVAVLEKILKRAIILKDIAGENIYKIGKYCKSGWKQIL